MKRSCGGESSGSNLLRASVFKPLAASASTMAVRRSLTSLACDVAMFADATFNSFALTPAVTASAPSSEGRYSDSIFLTRRKVTFPCSRVTGEPELSNPANRAASADAMSERSCRRVVR